jgi:replicative DNA helicase
MNEEMENVVLQNLMKSDSYYAKVYSHLDESLFQNPNNATIFSTIKNLTNDYNKRPSPQEVGLAIKQNMALNKTLQSTTISKFKDVLREPPVENMDFLIDKTQTWVQRIKLSKTIFEAADIIQNDGSFDPIPSMVEESLNINFDTSVGLDYGSSIEERLEYYKSREAFTPIGLSTLDKVLGGGIRPGSLFMFIGPTHTGKTAAKVFTSSNLLLRKKNVLFITLEMPEKEIAKRIDSNVIGTTINDLSELDNEELLRKWNQVKDSIGELVIKEYGAGTFNTMQLKALLDELKSKKNFIPDAIVVDYLGLMVSHRANKDSNSYDSLGKVAEDLHAIAKETYDSKGNKGIMMISSSQAGRAAIGNTEAGMENISESLKIAMTADVAIMLINNDQMREQNQQIWKIVKNRYTGLMPSLMMETDFARMTYKPYDDGNSYESVDQEELNTAPIVQPKKDDFDFGQLNF